jgi:DNA-binding transcriptional ArsR family regulator
MGKTHLEHYENSGKIDLIKIEDYINKLKVIVHPVRYAIIVLLINNRKMSVTEIYHELSIPQAVASGHLKLMSANGILCSKRSGKKSYYSVNYKIVKKLLDAMRLGINAD